MTRFIQIIDWYNEEYSDENKATFKCLSCYNIYGMYRNDVWKYCPKCGNELETVFQELKKVYPKYVTGSYTCLVNNKWTCIQMPTFTVVMELRSKFWNDSMWMHVDKSPMTDSHRNLKYNLKCAKKDDDEVRFRIIPSKVLPLP